MEEATAALINDGEEVDEEEKDDRYFLLDQLTDEEKKEREDSEEENERNEKQRRRNHWDTCTWDFVPADLSQYEQQPVNKQVDFLRENMKKHASAPPRDIEAIARSLTYLIGAYDAPVKKITRLNTPDFTNFAEEAVRILFETMTQENEENFSAQSHLIFLLSLKIFSRFAPTREMIIPNMPLLVKIITTQKENVYIQKTFCRMMWNLCIPDDRKARVMKAFIISPILDAMEYHKTEEEFLWAAAYVLGYADDTTHNELGTLMRQRAVPVLLGLIDRFPNSCEVTTDALGAITAILTLPSVPGMTSHLIPSVVAYFSRFPEEQLLLESVLGYVYTMSVYGYTAQLVSAGAIRETINAMVNNPRRGFLLEKACWVLSHLYERRDEFSDKVLKEMDQHVQQSLHLCFRALQSFYSRTLKYSSLVTLWKLGRFSKKLYREMTDMGVVQEVLKSVTKYPNVNYLAQAAHYLLSELLEEDEGSRWIMSEAGVPVLLSNQQNAKTVSVITQLFAHFLSSDVITLQVLSKVPHELFESAFKDLNSVIFDPETQ